MGKIKALLRSVFRYRLISAFFIISQLVMFYAVFGVLSIYNKAYAKETDRLQSMYKDRKSTRLNSSHRCTSRMPSSA